MGQAPAVPRERVGRRPLRRLRHASDERLVELVRAGQDGAFEELYDRHSSSILAFCRHMLGAREEAEDVVQHTFFAAYRDLVSHERVIATRPWLFAIARNRCVSILRARRDHDVLDATAPCTAGLSATVERREDVRELLGDLVRLPSEQRTALLLAELGALDHAEIATVLGCRREKVKALVFQARSSLAASRDARATPCAEIRAQLATASGGELRRSGLRHHLRACAGCRAFKSAMARQHELLALALPVVPSAALKAATLSGASGAAAASAGASATVTSTGAASGGLSMFGGGTIAKLSVTVALAGSVAGGGALTLQQGHHHRDRAVPLAPTASAARSSAPEVPAVAASEASVPQPPPRSLRHPRRADPRRTSNASTKDDVVTRSPTDEGAAPTSSPSPGPAPTSPPTGDSQEPLPQPRSDETPATPGKPSAKGKSHVAQGHGPPPWAQNKKSKKPAPPASEGDALPNVAAEHEDEEADGPQAPEHDDDQGHGNSNAYGNGNGHAGKEVRAGQLTSGGAMPDRPPPRRVHAANLDRVRAFQFPGVIPHARGRLSPRPPRQQVVGRPISRFRSVVRPLHAGYGDSPPRAYRREL